MELLIALAMKFWQWSLLILIVIIGFGVNLLDKNKKPNLKFNFKGSNELKFIIIMPMELQYIILKLKFQIYTLMR